MGRSPGKVPILLRKRTSRLLRGNSVKRIQPEETVINKKQKEQENERKDTEETKETTKMTKGKRGDR